MINGNTIIGLFAYVSLGALTLWAIHDLWVVMAVLFFIAVAHALATRRG